MARKVQSNNTSGYPGVVRASGSSSWCAWIYIEGKRTHLGSFKSAREAAAARRKAEAAVEVMKKDV